MRNYKQEPDGSFTLLVSKKITQQDIDDIMSTALEGGINYWCCKAEVAESQYYGEYASDQISRGGSLILYDAESDEFWRLTLDKLMRGITKAIESGYVASDNLDDWDAADADAIVQCGLFGDLVFG